MLRQLRLIDIGANLTDGMYQGIYHGKQIHVPDLHHVLKRASSVGVERIIVTSGSLNDGAAAIRLCQENTNSGLKLYTTIGCHPTRSSEFLNHFSSSPEPAQLYLKALQDTIDEQSPTGRVVAIGECGLDYDRLSFCSKSDQKSGFEYQFQLASKYQLPMFLHNRNTGTDFYDMVKNRRNLFTNGVVHSFTGDWDEAKKLIELGLYIGINGCSLKTLNGIEVVKNLPVDRIMLETDAPWCDIRPSHAGFNYVTVNNLHKRVVKEKHSNDCLVKSRNEPCTMVDVLSAVSNIRGESSIHDFADAIWKNTMDVFFPDETRQ